MSNISGPSVVSILTPQPIQVPPGAAVPVRFRVDVPRGLGPRRYSGWSTTLTDATGQTYETRSLLTGYQPRGLIRVGD